MKRVDLLSFFSRSPEKQISRARKKVREPHGDASVRMGAAQKLFEMGTTPAFRALLDRFTISVSPSSEDEREKEEVLRWLVSAGLSSVAALEDFLRTERNVYWPVRALREILSADEFASKIQELLGYFWQNPPASPEPIVQLIRAIVDFESKEIKKTVSRFLEDPDDDVVLAAADCILSGSEERGRESILKSYLGAEDRPRVRAYLLAELAEKGWTVKGFRPAVEESLPDGYALTREGRVKVLGIGREL